MAIENHRQYLVTMEQADRFASAIAEIDKQEFADPLMAKLKRDSLESQYADLCCELAEYEQRLSFKESILLADEDTLRKYQFWVVCDGFIQGVNDFVVHFEEKGVRFNGRFNATTSCLVTDYFVTDPNGVSVCSKSVQQKLSPGQYLHLSYEVSVDCELAEFRQRAPLYRWEKIIGADSCKYNWYNLTPKSTVDEAVKFREQHGKCKVTAKNPEEQARADLLATYLSQCQSPSPEDLKATWEALDDPNFVPNAVGCLHGVIATLSEPQLPKDMFEAIKKAEEFYEAKAEDSNRLENVLLYGHSELAPPKSTEECLMNLIGKLEAQEHVTLSKEDKTRILRVLAKSGTRKD